MADSIKEYQKTYRNHVHWMPDKRSLEEVSTTDLEESGMYKDHKRDGSNSLCNFGMGLIELNLAKMKKHSIEIPIIFPSINAV
jgi:hypothetical protein